MSRDSFGRQLVMTVLPILVSLGITALIVLAVGANPLQVLEYAWEGAFRDSRAFGIVVNFWLPLLLVSMGLVVTFTAGLWNIGVEGQMVVGALFATWAALTLPLPAVLLVPVELLLAALGGALWAALVGFLRVRLGVHEIFGGVALNALSNVLTIYLISGPWQPPEGGSVRSTPQFPDAALLTPIAPDFKVSLLMLVIAVAACVAVVLALRGTRWGLQLKAAGKNARSALLLGVPTTRTAMSAFIVCGALAGVAGSYRALLDWGSLRPLVSGGVGFLGLLVVLLATVRPLWVPAVAFAFAVIKGGSARLSSLQLESTLSGVFQGVIVLTVLLFNGLRARLEANRAVPPAASVPAQSSPAADTVQQQAGSHE